MRCHLLWSSERADTAVPRGGSEVVLQVSHLSRRHPPDFGLSNPELSKTVVVRPNGDINVPRLNAVRVAGLSVELASVVVGGFTFGKITDFERETCDEGDAFVVAPDNSRAGLVWEITDKTLLSRNFCARSGAMGSLGPLVSKCYDEPRKCPQESRVYSS